MAQEGDAESQFSLAKRLILEAERHEKLDDLANASEKRRLGIMWLTEAVKQGHEESYNYLKECFTNGIGFGILYDSIIREVEECLAIDVEERKARRAAVVIYQKLLADSRDGIVKQEDLLKLLLAAMKGGGKKVSISSLDSSSIELIQPSELEVLSMKLSQSNLLHAAALFIRGHTPFINTLHRNLDRERSKSFNFFQQAMMYPIFTAQMTHDQWMDLAKLAGEFLTVGHIPVHLIQTLVLFLIYSFLSSDALRLIIPLSIFFSAFLLFMISSLEIIRMKQMMEDFRLWAHLLALVQPDIDHESTEQKYLRNNRTIYLRFFGSLAVFLWIFPFISKAWIPASELFVLSGVMAVVTFFLMHTKFDRYTILSLCLVTVVLVPRTWRELGGIYNTVFEALITVGLGMGVVLNMSLPAWSLCLLPGVYLSMAVQKSWHGIYKYCLPHLVFVCWFALCPVFFPDTTTVGLTRALFVILFGFIFLPVLSILLISIPALALGKSLVEQGAVVQNIVTSILLAITPVATTVLHYKKNKFVKAMPFVQLTIFVGILSFLYPTWRENSIYASMPPVIDNLEFDAFRTLCHKPAWEQSTIANAQSQCSHFQDLPVVWDGVISAVKVLKISNRFEESAKTLPNLFEAWLRCTFGVQYSDCDTEVSELEQQQCKAFLDTRLFKCHLKNWNLYSFEIMVQVGTTYYTQVELPLDADTTFTDFAFNLTRGDKVKFQGILSGDVGGLKPRIQLMAVACLKCVNEMQPVAVIEYRSFWLEVSRGFAFVFNYVFAPAIEIRLEALEEEY